MATTATMHGPARAGAREASTVSCDAPWPLDACNKSGESNLGILCRLPTMATVRCRVETRIIAGKPGALRGLLGALSPGLVSYG